MSNVMIILYNEIIDEMAVIIYNNPLASCYIVIFASLIPTGSLVPVLDTVTSLSVGGQEKPRKNRLCVASQREEPALSKKQEALYIGAQKAHLYGTTTSVLHLLDY
jgi:hypothetical protein